MSNSIDHGARSRIRAEIISKYGSIVKYAREKGIYHAGFSHTASLFFHGINKSCYNGSRLATLVGQLQRDFPAEWIDMEIRETVHARSVTGGAA